MKRLLKHLTIFTVIIIALALPSLKSQAQCENGGCTTCGTCSDNAFAVMNNVFSSCIVQNGPQAYNECHRQAVAAACTACVQGCSPCMVCLVICGL